MLNLTDSQRSQLWKKFRSKVYRHAFVASHISTNIAAQIYAIREARGWTQKELADATGMAQTRISLMEDPSYDRFSLRTLRRLASAFDVALVVRFVPFSELLDSAVNVTPDRMATRSFLDEQGSSVSSKALDSTTHAVYEEKNVVQFPVSAGTRSSSRPDKPSDTESSGSLFLQSMASASSS